MRSGDASEDRFVERVKETMQEYAPPVPRDLRDEMWQEIQAQRKRAALNAHRGGEVRRDASGDPEPHPERSLRWARPLRGLAAAAVLVVAFSLGWMMARNGAPPPGGDGESVATATEAGSNAWSYMPQAAEHLVEAEMLLVLFASQAEPVDGSGVQRWARNLLGTTRMLLDSDAGRDPKLGEPLRDLELVLVQIANLSDTDGSERGYIHQSLRQRQVLEKIRAVSEAELDEAITD